MVRSDERWQHCPLILIFPPPGHIPTGAVQGGYNDSNDPLYIGRARHEDSFAVGKVRSTLTESG